METKKLALYNYIPPPICLNGATPCELVDDHHGLHVLCLPLPTWTAEGTENSPDAMDDNCKWVFSILDGHSAGASGAHHMSIS